MNKAVFLDRDGVLNKKKLDHVKSTDELEIFSYISRPIQKLHENGFLVVVITNQASINRGLTTHEKVNEIHEAIQKYLNKNNTHIDAFYYCPHRPDENCLCRKPKSGLLVKAIHDMNIDPKLSWMIGDSDSDILSGRSISSNTIKVDTNFNLEMAVDLIFRN